MTPSGSPETFAVIIVGGGTAGIDIAARLARHIRADRILLFEPSETHYYQPLFTLVGGGVARLSESARPTRQLIPAGIRWMKERIEGFDPEANEVIASSGRYKQAPILVQNLLAARQGVSLGGRYDGYTSCPLVTGNGRAILAEFDYDGKPCETFPFDQGKERRSMYLLKKYVLPQLYWHGMMRGLA